MEMEIAVTERSLLFPTWMGHSYRSSAPGGRWTMMPTRCWPGSTLNTAASWPRCRAIWSGPRPGWPKRTRCSPYGSACLVDWPDDDDDDGRLHWKTRHLVECAAERRFVWVDEITDVDRTWVATSYSAPALLHPVDPRCGLTDADYHAIAEWLLEDGFMAQPRPSATFAWPPRGYQINIACGST